MAGFKFAPTMEDYETIAKRLDIIEQQGSQNALLLGIEERLLRLELRVDILFEGKEKHAS